MHNPPKLDFNSHTPRQQTARMSGSVMTELETCFANYHSTAALNDMVWASFEERVDSIDFLKAHRDWVEKNSWGFGDRAFHYMWYLLLRDDVLNRPAPELLEIGVYKGQVISLWALIATQLRKSVLITGVSPFQARKPWFSKNRALKRVAQLIVSSYREDVRTANLYENDDYLDSVRRIFVQFCLSDANVSLLRGYSQEKQIQQQLAGRRFNVIYIDGGHRFEEVAQDLRHYSELVAADGYLVLDDASCDQPGSRFWKGHESVSNAVREWGAPGFINVLNVGHNRVYQRKL
jgi:hypothetical protein